jgi:hypothetical protein
VDKCASHARFFLDLSNKKKGVQGEGHFKCCSDQWASSFLPIRLTLDPLRNSWRTRLCVMFPDEHARRVIRPWSSIALFLLRSCLGLRIESQRSSLFCRLSDPFMDQQEATYYERDPFLAGQMVPLDSWDIGLQFPRMFEPIDPVLSGSIACSYRTGIDRISNRGARLSRPRRPLGQLSYRTRKKRTQVARALRRMLDNASTTARANFRQMGR